MSDPTPLPNGTTNAHEATASDLPIDMATTIERLAALDGVSYERVRKAEAVALGCRPSALDAMVRRARKVAETAEKAAAAQAAKAQAAAVKAAKVAEDAAKAEADQPPPVSDEHRAATIERLADLDPLAYDKERLAEAKRLGLPRVSTLDAQVSAVRKARAEADERDRRQREKAEQANQTDGIDMLDQAEAVARLLALEDLAYALALPAEAERLHVPPKTLDRAVKAARRRAAQEAADAAIAAVVERFNERYIVVLEAGKALVYQTTYDADLRRETTTTIAFEDLRKLFMNETILTGVDAKGQPAIKNVADVWLKSPDRTQYINGVTFDPSGRERQGVLNLWKGFGVQPQPGDWSIMQGHIHTNLCGGNAAYSEWLTDWLARTVQFPAEAAEIAVVLRGRQGTGKGTLARAFHRIFGRHWLAVSNARHLVGSFNKHLRDCVFLFADEAFFAGDRANVGALNALITEPFLTIESKGVDIGEPVPNRLHVMMASNEDWVVPASCDARRYFVLDVTNLVRANKAYFDDLNEQMENGGYEAMLHDLLHRDLSNFDFRHAPVTEALQQQQKLSLGTKEQWWQDCLYRGHVFQSKCGLQQHFGQWDEIVSTGLLYESYLQFAQNRRERHPLSREALGGWLTSLKYTPTRPRGDCVVGEQITDVANSFGSSRQGVLVKTYRAPSYHLGTLEIARAAFVVAMGLPVEWPKEGDGE